ncbi:MAG: D-alanyl-D-alanine carboxypeptidase/D-alanyl-D-alanine endopeptidase [Oligoflexus sp.]
MLFRSFALVLGLGVLNVSVTQAKSELMPQDGGEESILIQRLSDGKVLYESGSDKALIPASVTKIVTSAALLHYFSPAHTFKTRFYAGGPRNGDTIQGPLIVKGDGDPLLISEKLWQLAADLKHMGIREFTGDLIIDNSLFDAEKRDESRIDSAQASQNAYDAPVSAFGVNFNTLPIAIAPSRQSGKPALVSVDPYDVPDIEIVNRTVTGAGQKNSIQAVRQGQGRDSTLIVSGTIGVQAPVAKLYRAMGDPVLEGASILRAFLREAGITVKGRTREAVMPSGSTPLYTLESYDLGFIVRGLNHYSNNYIADVLVKRLGAAFPRSGAADGSGSGTLENGVAAIERFLRDEIGIKDRFAILNGSGLDSRNRLSAAQMVKILVYMQSRMDVYPEFLASFPASGWSGTLEKRFKGRDQNLLHGLVRAKTGTLSQPVSVSSLAGYLGHPKQGPLAFAIINNGRSTGGQTSVAEFRQRQDRALLKILEEL